MVSILLSVEVPHRITHLYHQHYLLVPRKVYCLSIYSLQNQRIIHTDFLTGSLFFCFFFFFYFLILLQWRRQWHPTPVLLPGKSHGRRSLVGSSPWGHEESNVTERLHFPFLLSCIGEGNGNPLQYSCLENPRNGGAWWAAIYGVAQSRTRMMRLSSSSSSYKLFI